MALEGKGMKHALLLLIALLGIYLAFSLTDAKERNKVFKSITKHVIFVAAIITLVFTIVALAVYFPASSLI